MEYSMYVCPECRKVFKVKGNGKRVKCTKCADKLLIDLEIEEDKWVTYSRESKNSIIDEAIIGEEIIEVEEEETLEKTQNQRINDSNQSMQNSSLSEKKKDSKLSIVAAILGFFGGIWIFMVAGTVIAIVDLVKGKNDGKRHLGSYFCLVMAVCCLIVSLNSKSSTKKADENTAKNSSVTQTEQTSDKASEENTTDNSSTTKTEQASDTVTEENSKDTVNESQADSEESNSKKFGVNAAESTKDMRLGDIGEKSGIFVGLSYVKRMSYLQTALGKEDISTDNEVILGFFDFLNGMDKDTAISTMLDYLTKTGIGEKKVNYKFREWIFARQRYWGEPVPVVHLADGSIYALNDDELPLILPEMDDYKGHNGNAPLENADEWKNYSHNGVVGKRETSTMPGSAGSSWYFLRYVDPHNCDIFCDKKLADHWLPVDLYIGGPEHAVGHLIYSRIWTKFLHDQGYISFDEPFKKLVHQGMILGANGIKMGKRYPEFVINPSDVVKSHGADSLRLYEMFMGPLEASKPWSNQGLDGAHKFIERVYRAIIEMGIVTNDEVPELDMVYNQTVKKVSEDFENLAFNTAISQMMIFINEVYKINKLPKKYAEGFVKLISCVTPHIGEEMWEKLGHNKTIAFEPWPTYDQSKLVKKTCNLAVSVNGKLRATLEVALDLDDESAKMLAFENDAVKRHIEGKEIKKVIVVKNKIVNIVAL